MSAIANVSVYDTVRAAHRATVLHGEGEDALLAFRNAAALDAMARLVRLHDLGNSNRAAMEQVEEIGAWLLGRPAEELRGVCEQPAFRVWLGDAERALRSNAPDAGAILRRLPYIFLRDLPLLERKTWRAGIPATGRAAPIGLLYRHGTGRVDEPVTIRTDDGESRIEGTAMARVPRNFTMLDIEIFDTGDFPELSRQNSEHGGELGASAADPTKCLAAAFHFLVEAWPESLPDLMAVFRGVVALDAPGGHTYSASAPTSPLIVQLTLRPNEYSIVLAETIVHETAHLKLHTLNEMQPLLVDDGEARYRHPWRPDLRPMQGVLLGAHAFLNVTRMYEKAIENGSKDAFVHRERAVRLGEVREALGTLARHARFTPAGHTVFGSMCREAGFQP